MKRLCILILILLLLPVSVSAHSGKTDSNGGHWDRSKGEYHYHHGYPAHDHYDMDGDGKKDCPYLFKENEEEKTDTIVLPSIPEYSFPVFTAPEYPTVDPSYKNPTDQDEPVSPVLIIFFGLVFWSFIGWCLWLGRRPKESK